MRAMGMAALLAAGLGFLPGFGGPSYPSALVLGLLLPSLAGLHAGLTEVSSGSLERGLLRGCALGAMVGLSSLAVLLLHALRTGLCDPGMETLQFLLGPGVGSVLGGGWGSLVGLGLGVVSQKRARRVGRWVVVVLVVSGPLASIALGVVRFYTSPMVYAFDPFVGYFAGSIYDTAFDPTGRLCTYRAGTLGLLLAAWALSRLVVPYPKGGLCFCSPVRAPELVLVALGLGVAGAVAVGAERLGHRSSRSGIERTLGHHVRRGRCDVVYGNGATGASAALLAQDCDGWLRLLERRWGAGGPPTVTVLVFDGAAQKERLMGAGRTQIAKPWRREIYLNDAQYPQGVLGHELAHLVVGEKTPGPFRTAGKLGGWLPNPGLIEGVAVALAPDEDDDLTPAEWSRALLEERRLPSLDSLFGMGFLSQNGSLAYTVAGAFVEWLLVHQGPAKVRGWYRGTEFSQVFGRSLPSLESEFHAHLRTLPLSASAREAARARFARPGLFVRRCPHAVDRALRLGEEQLGGGAGPTGCGPYEHARALDPLDYRPLLGLARCQGLAGSVTAARRIYDAISRDATQLPLVRDRAAEAMLDLQLIHDEGSELGPQYLELARRSLDFDRRRRLEVKASANTEPARAALRSLFSESKRDDGAEGAIRALLSWAGKEPDRGLPEYLVGRNLWLLGKVDDAREHLERALSLSLSPPGVRAEALRLRTIVACAQGDGRGAVEYGRRALADEHLPEPRRLGILALVERCAQTVLDTNQPSVSP